MNDDTRIWLCLGNDGATVVFYIITCTALLVAAKVANKYWDHNYATDTKVSRNADKKQYNGIEIEILFM